MNGQGCQGYRSCYQGNQSCHAECIFKIWSDLMALGSMVLQLVKVSVNAIETVSTVI